MGGGQQKNTKLGMHHHKKGAWNIKTGISQNKWQALAKKKGAVLGVVLFGGKAQTVTQRRVGRGRTLSPVLLTAVQHNLSTGRLPRKMRE